LKIVRSTVSTLASNPSDNIDFQKKSVKGAIHTSLIKAMFTTDRFPIQIIRNQVLSIVFGRVEGIAHTKTRYPNIGGMLAIPDQKEREGRTYNLVTTLADLDMTDFPHCG
jgi:hypothetical protein